jgi:hypothetical protein
MSHRDGIRALRKSDWKVLMILDGAAERLRERARDFDPESRAPLLDLAAFLEGDGEIPLPPGGR